MFLVLVAIALLLLTAYVRRAFTYWERRGVPHLRPRIPTGHVPKLTDFRIRHLNAILQPSYDHFKDTGVPFVGLYFFHKPIALLLGADLIKHILIKDFDSFQDRGIYCNPIGDPLSANLLTLSGDAWRRMRHKLTPTFSSGKMKFMFPTMMRVADQLTRCLDDVVIDAGGGELELKDLLARFSTDIIGTCVFGIECNSLANPAAEFRQMGRRIFSQPRHGLLGSVFMSTSHRMARAFNMKVWHSDVSEFFLAVVDETVRYRETNGVKRNDFMDLLIELKNDRRENAAGLSLGEMAGQVFIFFLAGFETSSSSVMFALYEMAMNPDIQAKVREEIRQTMAKHGGEMSYEAMLEMPYLDQVINETLRKYTLFGTIVRTATRDYPVPGTQQTIAKGTQVIIPNYAIQHDPQHYPEPDRFDPERFSGAAKASRELTTFLPFGQGPRICIGIRFAMMQVRIGLVTLLSRYQIERSAKTMVPLRYSKAGIVLTCEGGMWLKLRKIDQ